VNMSEGNETACPICGERVVPVSKPFEGYVEGYVTTVLECVGCRARLSSRNDVPTWLYDRIYDQAEVIPGYGRYHRYEAAASKHPAPLDFLAEAEDPYWHVREHLRAQSGTGGLRVVELGCGAGYLTYALRQAGIDCLGVDISAKAIARAQARYGHPEWFQTLEEFNAESGAVDLVVALELIEHVPDPVSLVRQALSMLVAGGALLLTTPDRDACRPGEVWASDAPPVHLFWLGRQALQVVADNCAAAIDFPRPRPLSSSGPVPPVNECWPPVLTAAGDVTPLVSRSVGLAARLRLHASALLRRLSAAAAPPRTRTIEPVVAGAPRPGATLAAVLRRPATGD
jgi:SAM-dependent methyltransferase